MPGRNVAHVAVTGDLGGNRGGEGSAVFWEELGMLAMNPLSLWRGFSGSHPELTG